MDTKLLPKTVNFEPNLSNKTPKKNTKKTSHDSINSNPLIPSISPIPTDNHHQEDLEKQNSKKKNYLKIDNLTLTNTLESIMIKNDQFKKIQSEKLFISIMLFFLVLYFFSSLTLLIANCQPMEIIDTKYNVPFHMIDFWGSFIFTLVEASILINTNMLTIGSLRFLMIAFNIGMTLLAAVLFSMNTEFWEIPCHWIEFFAQIFITFSDMIFIFHQFKNTDNILYKYRYIEAGMISILVIGNCFKLLIFGDVIYVGMNGEQAAHFIEYIAEMCNTVIAFLFTIVTYRECDEKIRRLFIKDEFFTLQDYEKLNRSMLTCNENDNSEEEKENN